MPRPLLQSLLHTAEAAISLAVRAIDVVADYGHRRSLDLMERRLQAFESRLAKAERELEASRRVDRARMNEIERLRAGRYWD